MIIMRAIPPLAASWSLLRGAVSSAAVPALASCPQQQLPHRTSAAAGERLPRRWASGLANVISPEAGKTKLQGYLPTGFIVNGIQVEGSLLCLPDTWLLWDVSGLQHITRRSLAILDLVAPRPEVLIVGCGASMVPLPPGLKQELASAGVAVETLDTRNALSYFNFMNDEGRAVVAALLPAGHDPVADRAGRASQ